MQFRQTIDELNLFIGHHRVPREMAMRMRVFLHAQRDLQMYADTQKALLSLSPTLQVEVIL